MLEELPDPVYRGLVGDEFCPGVTVLGGGKVFPCEECGVPIRNFDCPLMPVLLMEVEVPNEELVRGLPEKIRNGRWIWKGSSVCPLCRKVVMVKFVYDLEENKLEIERVDNPPTLAPETKRRVSRGGLYDP